MAETKFRVGMIVKIASNKNGGNFPIGTIGKITERGHNPEFRVDTNNDYWFYDSSELRRPLKSSEAEKPIHNTGFTAAALWSELKRRQGGPYPCRKDFLIVTEGRFNAAVAAALRKA